MGTPTSTADKSDIEMIDNLEEIQNENRDDNDEEAATAAEDLEKGIIGVLDSPKVSVIHALLNKRRFLITSRFIDCKNTCRMQGFGDWRWWFRL